MKRKEFNNILKSITVVEDGKRKLSVELIRNLSNEVKNQIIQVLVRARQPVLADLINADTDIPWLHSMGYLYQESRSEYNFVTHHG